MSEMFIFVSIHSTRRLSYHMKWIWWRNEKKKLQINTEQRKHIYQTFKVKTESLRRCDCYGAEYISFGWGKDVC